MEYHSAIKRNESESVLVRWMNLDPLRIVKSKIEKQIPYINVSIYMESRRMALMNLFAEEE